MDTVSARSASISASTATNPQHALSMRFVRWILGFAYVLTMAALIVGCKPATFGSGARAGVILLLFLMGCMTLPYFAWLSRVTTRGGSRTRQIALAVAGTLALLAPTEVAFRLSRTAQPMHRSEYHPVLQTRLRPGDPTLPVNEHGLRGGPVTLRKSAGVFRIVLMGDATVLAENVALANTAAERLASKLATAYPARRIEVLNAGVPGYTSQHSLIRYLFDLYQFEPDLVILCHGVTDLERSMSGDLRTDRPFQRDYSHSTGRIDNMVASYFRPVAAERSSAGVEILDVLRRRLRPRPTLGDLDATPSLPIYRRNLLAFVERMRIDGVQCVLCTQPFGGAEDSQVSRALQRFDKATRDVATQTETEFVDLRGVLPVNEHNFAGAVQLTVTGNEQVAAALFQVLIARRLVD